MTNEELAVKIQNGECELIGQLWEQSVGALKAIAFKLYRQYNRTCIDLGIELKDVDQLSFFALTDAVKNYNSNRDYKFTTYLKFPYTKHLYELLGIKNTKRNGKYALINSVSSYADSLNIAIEDDDTERLDMLEDPKSGELYDDVIEKIYQSELRVALQKALTKIPDEYSNIIRERYFNGKLLNEINCSAMTQSVYYIHERALKMLKNDLELQAFHNEIIEEWAYKKTGFKAFKATGMSSVERAVIKAEDFYKGNIQRCNIMACIESNPKATQKQMGELLELSESQVNRHISKLLKLGRIRRVGSRKHGEWVVINNEP